MTEVFMPGEQAPSAATVINRSLTDDGNALRLVDVHQESFRYVPQRRSWLMWDDYRWTFDETGRINEAARSVIRGLGGTDALDKHRNRSLSARALRAMVELSTSDPRIVTSAATLDTDKWSLCTPAGVVNLRTGLLTEPSREQMHTKATPITVDFDLATPMWNKFLTETFAGDDTIEPFIQRLAGYSASGHVGHHVLPFLHGPGGNGKGVFLEVLRTVLGDYAIDAPHAFLMAGRERHETELARLHGARLVTCSEVNREDRFDEAKVKHLTGGDPVTGRFMRENFFTFAATHHLWLMGNHQPEVRSGGGRAFWRRLRLIPFANTPVVENDDLTEQLLTEEGSGILAWIVRGAMDVLANGLSAPASVKAATDAYAAEEDHFARFVEDCCLTGGGVHVREPMATVTKAYAKWCAEEGFKPVNNKVFGREIRAFNVSTAKSNGRKYYTGITLLDFEGSDPDASGSGTAWYEREPPDYDDGDTP